MNQPQIVYVQQPEKKSGCGSVLAFVFIVAVLLVIISRYATKDAGNSPAKQQYVTQENYDRIRVGMSFGAVEEILGNGWKEVSTVGDMQTYVWRDGIRSITVTFSGNVVSAKVPIGF